MIYLVWSGRVIRNPPLQCVADGFGCLIMAGPSGDSLPNKCWKTMTVTIWWPRSGVRIYQIVTRMTSDVDMPSTHLVRFWSWSVDFAPFGITLTYWNRSKLGFQAFPREFMEGMAWNLACWCILTTSSTVKIKVLICWFFLISALFWQVKFVVSWYFLENA